MNWKNRTYFQGRSARPFAQSADGSRAARKSKPETGEKPRRPFRRFLGWLFLFTVVFGAGLAVGLVEDYEGEEMLEDFRVQWEDNPVKNPKAEWLHIWKNYEHVKTKHFLERMECRHIEEDEITFVGKNAILVEHEPKTASCAFGFEAKYSIIGKTESGRSLTIIFSANNGTRKLHLITVWENGKDYPCKDD